MDEFQPSDQATYKCVATNMYNISAEAISKIGMVSIDIFSFWNCVYSTI